MDKMRKKVLSLLRQWKDNTGRQGPKNKNEVLSNRGHRGTEGPLVAGYAERNGGGVIC